MPTFHCFFSDLLESDILHESAFHLVSVYKTATEASFRFLLECSLYTSTQSLVCLTKASLHDNQSVTSNSNGDRSDLNRTKIGLHETEYHMSKHLTENIEDALCDSYRVLQRVIEEGARQTLSLLHMAFIACQAKLFDKLQEGLENGRSAYSVKRNYLYRPQDQSRL